VNVLVTGAAGFLGGHLVERLRPVANVYGLVHDKDPNWNRVGTRVLQGDVRDFPRVLECIVGCEIDQIYHCAAKSVVRNCRCDPLGCLETNAMGTAVVLEAARQSERVKGIMCMESDKSYGDGPVPYDEDQAPHPIGVYEASKTCSGYIAQCYHRNYGVPVFTVRSANVFGPGDENYSRLIPNTITRLHAGKPPQIVSGASQYSREFIYVENWVDVVQRLMEVCPWGEAVNVGSGLCYTVAEMVERICNLMGKPISSCEWNRPATLVEIPQQSLCLDKLKRLIGGVTITDLNFALNSTIDWYRNAGRTRLD